MSGKRGAGRALVRRAPCPSHFMRGDNMIFLIIFTIYAFYRWLCPRKVPYVLNVYFGVPGSGKTTFAAYLAKQCGRESRIITWARSSSSTLARRIFDSRFFKRAIPVYSKAPRFRKRGSSPIWSIACIGVLPVPFADSLGNGYPSVRTRGSSRGSSFRV